MTNLFNDLRYALRQLRKSPGFALTATLTLALGIGATTTIFSVVNGVLLRPLPFKDPGRLVVLSDTLQEIKFDPARDAGVTGPDVVAYTRDTQAFTSLGGYGQTGFELSGDGEPIIVNASRLGAGVLPALGVSPLLGRMFTEQEDIHREQDVILSYELWNSRFHGDRNIVGKKILLDRKPYIVIGVMPRNFEFPLVPGHMNQSQLWVPLSLTSQELNQGAGSWNFQMVGRLKPNITPAQAETDTDRVAAEIMRNYPAFMASMHIGSMVRPLREDAVAQARPLVHILFLAVCIVLLIACANLAGLLLVRAIRRRRETAVRLALGSSAAAMVRQSILESLLLSIAGGLIGIGLAAIALRVSIHLLPETLPRISDIGIDWRVVAFAVFLAIVTGILSAIAPAFAALHTNMNDVLKQGGRTGSDGSGHNYLRSSLVVAEIAVALMLLVASGLLLRSFEKMRDVDLGFRPEHVVTAMYSLPQQKYSTQSNVDTFNHALLRRLQQLPGAGTVALDSSLPMSGIASNNGFVVDGFVQPHGQAVNLGDTSQIEGEYFRAMGIPLLRGRFFTEADDDKAQLVIIVNRKLAEHYWHGQNPLGKRLRIGDVDVQTPWLTVVGEVADVKTLSPDGVTREQFYQPVRQADVALGPFASPTDLAGNSMFVALRTILPPEQMENSVRAVFHSLDPQLALMQVQSMERAVSNSEAPRKFNTTVITAFALAAVLLTILGIYSVIAFSVALRTHEMAIRMALGSSRSGVMRVVLTSAMRMALIGCGIGLAGAIAVSQVLRSLLFEVNSFDPPVLLCAVILILMLSIAASFLPARRASSIDPMQALKSE